MATQEIRINRIISQLTNLPIHFERIYNNSLVFYLRENEGCKENSFILLLINELKERISEGKYIKNLTKEELSKIVKEEELSIIVKREEKLLKNLKEKELSKNLTEEELSKIVKEELKSSNWVEEPQYIERQVEIKRSRATKSLKIEGFILEKLQIKLDRLPKELDFSAPKGTEKIIMLHQLGILDFLKEKEPFNLSTNALASVISGITGEKREVMQSYLNPIFSKNVSQKNNPLKTESTVKKIKNKLILIGYNPTE